jgi:hypothetical protein
LDPADRETIRAALESGKVESKNMSTQGILSITKRGTVLLKVVAGCNGYNIPHLAEALRKNPTTNTYKILLELCADHGVGCDECLIVQDGNAFSMRGGNTFDPKDEGGQLYVDKFHDPRFNPRWELGTAEYVEIVELTD